MSGSLWRHRDFLRLWAGDTLSQVGTQITVLALPLLAIKVLDADAFEVGLLTTFEFLAFLLIGLPAGAWVDRLRRRDVLVAADLGRAVLFGSIPLAWWLDVLTLPQVYAVALLGGVCTVFFDVAYQSYLPHLVGRDHLVEGNAKLQGTQSVAQVAGPALGGVLVQALTAPYAVLLDALSFLWSAAWVGSIASREPVPQRPPERHLLREVRRGPVLRPRQPAAASHRRVHRHRQPLLHHRADRLRGAARRPGRAEPLRRHHRAAVQHARGRRAARRAGGRAASPPWWGRARRSGSRRRCRGR